MCVYVVAFVKSGNTHMYYDIIIHSFVSVENIFNFDNHIQCVHIHIYIRMCISRTLIMSLLALLPLLCGTWILGLFFLIDSESELVAWIFTIINSLQVSILIYKVCINCL